MKRFAWLRSLLFEYEHFRCFESSSLLPSLSSPSASSYPSDHRDRFHLQQQQPSSPGNSKLSLMFVLRSFSIMEWSSWWQWWKRGEGGWECGSVVVEGCIILKRFPERMRSGWWGRCRLSAACIGTTGDQHTFYWSCCGNYVSAQFTYANEKWGVLSMHIGHENGDDQRPLSCTVKKLLPSSFGSGWMLRRPAVA